MRGGAGSSLDTLRISSANPVVLTAQAFANVRGLERIVVLNTGAASIELDNAMVASSDATDFQYLGNAAGDTVIGSGVLATPLLLDGGEGDDALVGGGGNDLLRVGNGADSADGGAGNDTVEVEFAALDKTDRLAGGLGSDTLLLLGPASTLTLSLFELLSGFERIALAPGSSGSFVAHVAADYANSPGLALTVVGGAENDTLSALQATVAVQLEGEGGDDRLVGSGFADTVLGGLGNDTAVGHGGNDVLDGGDGNDRLVGGDGNDLLLGSSGDDTLLGGAGADTLDLGAGIDRADGGTGNDLYRAQVSELNSSDLIADEDGTADTLELIDVINLANGAFFGINTSGSMGARLQGIERFLLGSGNDVFVASNATGDSAGANVVTVSGGAGDDRLDGSQVVRLTTPLAFLLSGDDGNDTLTGGRGADTLTAGTGSDRITGGLGNDVVTFAASEFSGLDTVSGDGGTDTLRFVGNDPLGADAFANVSGVEIIELGVGGQAVTLPGAFADGLVFTMSTIRGGSGDDVIDVSTFASNRRVTVELGDGNDTLVGSPGNDTVTAGAGVDAIFVGSGANRVTFAAGQLSALDTVQASTTDAFDTLVVGVAAGRTLAQGVFAGVSGFDTFNFDSGTNSAVRLPATLVSQSGQASVNVNVVGESMTVDGRAIASAFRIDGGADPDMLFGGSAADMLVGNGGDDTLIGGLGGDRIFLGTSSTGTDIALLRSVFDGTVDINGTLTESQLAGADSVSGTEFDGNFIKVDRFGFGLPDSTTWFVGAAQNISLNYSAARLEGVSIAGDAFGSLTSVRNAVGARFTNNDPAVFEKIILVITGASATRFGVYYFEDRDHNSTVDSTDVLRLLAIGTGAGPTFSGNSGFRLTSEFELL